MEIGIRTLNEHFSELRWVIQELQCILPATNTNRAVNSSIGECIERLNFALFNLDRNAKRLTKKKKKEKKNV